jgi:hypothetical protein
MVTFIEVHGLDSIRQCCGSVAFWYQWYRSRSADPYLDPDPAFSSVAVKMPTKISFLLSFLLLNLQKLFFLVDGFYELSVLCSGRSPSQGEGVWWVRKGRKYIGRDPRFFVLVFVPSPLCCQLAKAGCTS